MAPEITAQTPNAVSVAPASAPKAVAPTPTAASVLIVALTRSGVAIWLAVRAGQRRDDVDQWVGREQRGRGERDLSVGGGHAIADRDDDRYRPYEGEHGACDDDALR